MSNSNLSVSETQPQRPTCPNFEGVALPSSALGIASIFARHDRQLYNHKIKAWAIAYGVHVPSGVNANQILGLIDDEGLPKLASAMTKTYINSLKAPHTKLRWACDYAVAISLWAWLRWWSQENSLVLEQYLDTLPCN